MSFALVRTSRSGEACCPEGKLTADVAAVLIEDATRIRTVLAC
jgi:hypothetical protein